MKLYSFEDREIKNNIRYILYLIICICLGLIAYVSWRLSYWHRDISVWLGIGILPYVWTSIKYEKKSSRSIYFLFFVLLLSWFLPVASFQFWLPVIALACTMELLYAPTNQLSFFLLFFISLIFRYISHIFTFPIRLFLSKYIGHLLQFMGLPARVEGNTIWLQQMDFSYEPACLGLSMLELSLVMGVFMLSFFQKKTQKVLNIKYLIGFFVGVFLLNIINNFIRVFISIYFKIFPDFWIHDIVGLVCFGVYICWPMFYLAGWVHQRWSEDIIQQKNNVQVYPKKSLIFLILISHILILISVVWQVEKIYNLKKNPVLTSEHNLKYSVSKNDSILVYFKPIQEFYSIEHNPLYCWPGSGYSMKNITEEHVGSKSFYTALLVQNQTKLYTAWWFTDGQICTNSQWQWRWRALSLGRSFRLVNMTASSPEILWNEINKMTQ
jgi:exosortase N